MKPERHLPLRRGPCGYAAVVTLVFLSIAATLAVGFHAMLNTSIAMASNERAAAQALAAAESGLEFMKYQLLKASTTASIQGPSSEWGDTISLQLAYNLEGQGQLLSTGQITYAANAPAVNVPSPSAAAIRLKDGSSFRAQLVPDNALASLVLTVTGLDPSGKASRKLSIGINADPLKPADLGAFAMVAKGTIDIAGTVVYGYDPASDDHNSLTGRVYQPWGEGGASVMALLDPAAPDLAFQNPPPLTLPNPDVSFLAGMKGSILSRYQPPSASKPVETVQNAYIPPNTNRTFRDVVINGVLYVEWPNKLTLGGNVTLNGLIVYQRRPSSSTATSSITFPRGVTVMNRRTVAATKLAQAGLTPEQLSILSGWAILAPDTDFILANGNGIRKTFEQSLYINNLIQAEGQGDANTSLCLNQANIIAEGNVNMGGNRVFWILPPDPLAGAGSLGRFPYLYVMDGTYLEP